jgi:hypothetical protein
LTFIKSQSLKSKGMSRPTKKARKAAIAVLRIACERSDLSPEERERVLALLDRLERDLDLDQTSKPDQA